MHRELVLFEQLELTSLQRAPPVSDEGGVVGGVGRHTGGGWRARKRFSITANSATYKERGRQREKRGRKGERAGKRERGGERDGEVCFGYLVVRNY